MPACFQIIFLVAVLLKYHFIAETSCPADHFDNWYPKQCMAKNGGEATFKKTGVRLTPIRPGIVRWSRLIKG